MTPFAAIVEAIAAAWMVCAAVIARAFAPADTTDDALTVDAFRRSTVASAFTAASMGVERAWHASMTSRTIDKARRVWTSTPPPDRARVAAAFLASAAAVHLALLTIAGPSRVAAQWLVPVVALLVGGVVLIRRRAVS